MAASYQAMLATALTYAEGDIASRVAAWRQVVDILGQAGGRIPEDARAAALTVLAEIAGDVPVAQRRFAAASLAGRPIDDDLLAAFACDLPAVAAPVLTRLTLDDADWDALLPILPAASRNILRNRRDLPACALATLARFAPGDLALPATARTSDAAAPGNEDEPAVGTTPILDLVDRIAQYRKRSPVPAEPKVGEFAPSVEFFLFETDAEGAIMWVEGAPREAIVGLSLAHAAEPKGSGVDAAAAGAWRRRAPLGPCRLLIGGRGAASGDWTIDARPLFNPASGRFVGYRGEARRPRPGERAIANTASGGSDSIRQLVHELRTPLNAIQGFAAMIEGQLLGPAASAHREQSRGIVAEVERLVALIDDLDLAARLDAGLSAPAAPSIPLRQSVAQAVREQSAVLADRGVTLRFDASDLDASDFGTGITGAASSTDRIVARLLAAIGATAARGESLAVTVAAYSTQEFVTIARPQALHGVDTNRLLDPDTGATDALPDASLLSLGFTLRLCARLAIEVGGRLTIAADAFELSLPAAAARDVIVR